MSEDEKNLIRDTLRTPGWQLIVKKNQESVEDYRRLSTQEPGAVPQEMRTWYSGKAAGREETIQSFVDLLTSLQE